MDVVGTYQQTAIGTQGQGRLITLLYDGAIRYLRQAGDAIDSGNYPARTSYINKAQDIIFELNSVLDMEKGGEIAVNLRRLYNFMWGYLNKANIKSDCGMIDEVAGLLAELNSAWRAVAL